MRVEAGCPTYSRSRTVRAAMMPSATVCSSRARIAPVLTDSDSRTGRPGAHNGDCVFHPGRTSPADDWGQIPVVCGTTQFSIERYVLGQGLAARHCHGNRPRRAAPSPSRPDDPPGYPGSARRGGTRPVLDRRHSGHPPSGHPLTRPLSARLVTEARRPPMAAGPATFRRTHH